MLLRLNKRWLFLLGPDGLVEQSCAVEASVMGEVLHVRVAQYGSHEPLAAVEHLKREELKN